MRTEKTKLKEIIHRFLNGNATDEEVTRLEEYYHSFDDEPDILDLLSPDEVERLGRQMHSRIRNAIRNNNATRFVFPFKWAIAASIFLCLCVGACFYVVKFNTSSIKAKLEDGAIVPGKDRALLTLGSGKSVALEKAAQGLVASQNGVSIKKNSSGEVVYEAGKLTDKETSALAYNVVSTPRGGQFTLVLPDGTKVWLNAASSLKFPVAFHGKKRQVELVGEAYFEVAEDKKHPFIIGVRETAIEVLGTHFNVSAYQDEKSVKTTLLSGSVKVKGPGWRKVLVPGQQADVTDGRVDIYDVDAKHSVAWKDGLFRFDGDTIEGILLKISRWYNVEIVYETQPSELQLTGIVSKFENVSEVLKMLELTGIVHFKIEGRRIIVLP